MAYLLQGSRFEVRRIEIGKRGESLLVVASGLAPDDRVALKDPTGKG